MAPFSHFKVGAALETADGAVISGCNVENATYGLTICAERSAIVRMVAEGHRGIAAIAVAGRASSCSPCGACRQVIWEFAEPGTTVTFPHDGGLSTFTIEEILPAGFRL